MVAWRQPDAEADRPSALARLHMVAKAMRVHQGAKNVLISAPILAAHHAALPT